VAEEVFGVVLFLNDLFETVDGGNAELVLLRLDAIQHRRKEKLEGAWNIVHGTRFDSVVVSLTSR